MNHEKNDLFRGSGAVCRRCPARPERRGPEGHYVEGWQAGDTERVARAVSTELAKSRVVTQSGFSFVTPMGCSLLLAATMGNKSGVRVKDLTPDQPFKLEVKILDVDGANASVKAWNAKYGFFDYMHMAKVNNEWKIINVLWDMSAPPADK